jgi:Protein of unknown function (DUF3050)
MNPINHIQSAIEPLRQTLLNHPVYDLIESLPELNIFMEHHIFAVWDFMSLLKALQRELTCVEVPWVPRGSPVVRKLINEIVLGVETGPDQEGWPASHYEVYLDAMEGTCADTSAIKDLIREVSFGKTVATALEGLSVRQEVKNFVQYSFDTIARTKAHEIASLFTFGREHLIPEHFSSLVEDLEEEPSQHQVDGLLYYLGSPLEVAAGQYHSMAMQMIVELCGEDDNKWEECRVAAIGALERRVALWDSIAACIQERRQELGARIYADNTDC